MGDARTRQGVTERPTMRRESRRVRVRSISAREHPSRGRPQPRVADRGVAASLAHRCRRLPGRPDRGIAKAVHDAAYLARIPQDSAGVGPASPARAAARPPGIGDPCGTGRLRQRVRHSPAARSAARSGRPAGASAARWRTAASLGRTGPGSPIGSAKGAHRRAPAGPRRAAANPALSATIRPPPSRHRGASPASRRRHGNCRPAAGPCGACLPRLNPPLPGCR